MESKKKKPVVPFIDICAYVECSNNRQQVSLYCFPKKSNPLCAEWLSRICNPALKYYSCSTLRRMGVCEEHFTPEMFKPALRSYPNGRKTLKKNAVPEPSDHLVQKWREKLKEFMATRQIRRDHDYGLKEPPRETGEAEQQQQQQRKKKVKEERQQQRMSQGKEHQRQKTEEEEHQRQETVKEEHQRQETEKEQQQQRKQAEEEVQQQRWKEVKKEVQQQERKEVKKEVQQQQWEEAEEQVQQQQWEEAEEQVQQQQWEEAEEQVQQQQWEEAEEQVQQQPWKEAEEEEQQQQRQETEIEEEQEESIHIEEQEIEIEIEMCVNKPTRVYTKQPLTFSDDEDDVMEWTVDEPSPDCGVLGESPLKKTPSEMKLERENVKLKKQNKYLRTQLKYLNRKLKRSIITRDRLSNELRKIPK